MNVFKTIIDLLNHSVSHQKTIIEQNRSIIDNQTALLSRVGGIAKDVETIRSKLFQPTQTITLGKPIPQ